VGSAAKNWRKGKRRRDLWGRLVPEKKHSLLLDFIPVDGRLRKNLTWERANERIEIRR
jgi:hypothetical protein